MNYTARPPWDLTDPERAASVDLAWIYRSFADHRGFRHPFWDWIETGELSLEVLKEFALLYYEHVKYFRQYIARALSVVAKESTQIVLAHILADEYGISEEASHPEMYRRFMRSLGLEDRDFADNQPIPGIQHFRRAHFELFSESRTEETLGAVAFGCESSTPYRHGKVIAGIGRVAENHGLAIDDTFFSAHIEIDDKHSSLLMAELKPLLANARSRERLAEGARISFDAREVFLDGVMQALGVD